MGMFTISGVAKENEFDLEGFESEHDARCKLQRIGEDFYGFGTDLFEIGSGGGLWTGKFRHSDGSTDDDSEWSIREESAPRVSESMRALIMSVGNVPEFFAWQGEDDELGYIEAVETDDPQQLSHVSIGYRAARPMGSTVAALDGRNPSGCQALWVEFPATSHDDEGPIVHESNYHTLVQAFGELGLFVSIASGSRYSGQRLAMPLHVEVPDEVARVFVMLADESPSFDEMDHSERESNRRDEDWENMGLSDFVGDVVRALEGEVNFDRRDDYADDHVTDERADEFVRTHHSEEFDAYQPDAPGGDHWRLDDAVEALAREIAAELRIQASEDLPADDDGLPDDFDPTTTVASMRETKTQIDRAVEEYFSDPGNERDPSATGDHYDNLSNLYESIADDALALDKWLSAGGALPDQWAQA